MTIDLHPLSPLMHPAYIAAMQSDLPEELSAEVRDLVSRRNTVPEDEIESIDGQLVARLYWYALRPDEIAARVMARHHLRSPVSVEDATLILAALGEAGYPIHGNGAPDYAGRRPRDPAPVSGAERAQVIWSAAQYWASAAADGRYISLGDCRGYLPRPVQHDSPGQMHPMQRAALTLGPTHREGASYMRAHTRRLVLVRR
jgi:hypothetical protein